MAEAQTLEGDPGKAISHLLISGGSDLKCTEVVVVDRHIPEVVNATPANISGLPWSPIK
jgi:hypothetical protein